jgi:hypothetical protein
LLHWEAALKECDVTATCNDGIHLIPIPDYYAVMENECLAKYKPQYELARKCGTVLLISDRVAGRDQMDMDEVLPVMGPEEYDVDTWGPGIYRQGMTTGSFLVQYAANHGAREIHLVGFDGYHKRAGPVELIKTECYQGPLFARMAEVMPETQFIFYGRPRYAIADLSNVQCMEATTWDATR